MVSDSKLYFDGREFWNKVFCGKLKILNNELLNQISDTVITIIYCNYAQFGNIIN